MVAVPEIAECVVLAYRHVLANTTLTGVELARLMDRTMAEAQWLLERAERLGILRRTPGNACRYRAVSPPWLVDAVTSIRGPDSGSVRGPRHDGDPPSSDCTPFRGGAAVGPALCSSDLNDRRERPGIAGGSAPVYLGDACHQTGSKWEGIGPV